MIHDEGFTPATPAQIKYATSLGIGIDPNESLSSLSYKISYRLDPDHFVEADRSVLAQADYFGIHSPTSKLRDDVLRCITDSVLVANRDQDLCHWYLYRTYLHLAPGARHTPPNSDSPLFHLSSSMRNDQKYVGSVRNEAGRCNLDKFGTPSTEYGVYPRIATVKTYAYKTSVARIRDALFRATA